MSVFRKKRENGTFSENWYYKFVVNGKRYKGSTFKNDKQEALEYEEDIKRKIRALYDDRPIVSDKEKQRNLLNFREKITAEIQGNSIALESAWEIFRRDAPAKLKKIPNEKGWAAKEGYWIDFLYFLEKHHQGCKTLREVTPAMAEEYISLVKTSGKVKKDINCNGKIYQSTASKLSSSSINKYIIHLRQIFRILSPVAGLMENPFDGIQKAVSRTKKREVFEIEELERIDAHLKALKNKPLIFRFDKFNFLINEALFIIGINTGLRRGNICLLKWSEVNFNKRAIIKEASKSEATVFIPISKVLHDFLKEKETNRKGQYVVPELADLYLKNDDGVSYRFKKMLKELGIESLKAHDGRSRRTSSKDIHALRHTFCYLHGIQGTDLVTLQSMVGHLDKKMTEAYMMHQTEELKRDAIEKFSMKGFTAVFQSPLDRRKKLLIQKIENSQSESLIEQAENLFQIKTGLELNDNNDSPSFRIR